MGIGPERANTGSPMTYLMFTSVVGVDVAEDRFNKINYFIDFGNSALIPKHFFDWYKSWREEYTFVNIFNF